MWEPLPKAVRLTTHIVLVNILMILTSLGGILGLSSAIAGYSSLRALIRTDDERVIGNYFRSLKEQLVGRTMISIAFLLVTALIVTNIRFLQRQATPVALPLYVLNVIFFLAMLTAAAAVIRRLAIPGSSVKRSLLPALRDAVQASPANLAILGSGIVSVAIIILSPLTAFFCAASLPLAVMVLTQHRFHPTSIQEP